MYVCLFILQIVGCNCTEAYTGNDCSLDRDDCAFSVCYPGVLCIDIPAPDFGFLCGSCPEGTTGQKILNKNYNHIVPLLHKCYNVKL